MLEALKFVQGAIAKKDFVPVLTHFRIEDGFIKGFNGAMALCSPIDLDLSVSPKASTFAKAIRSCKDTVAISMTPSGRLSIKSGKFKSFIECSEDPFPAVEPEGEMIELDGSLLESLLLLAPFMGQDASRPWAMGILLKGGSAYTTNNIVLIEKWLGYTFPVTVNIPSAAVKELLRIKKEPKALQVSETSITFHFEDGRWLKSQLSSLKWPDLTPIFERECSPVAIEEDFFEAIETLEPLANDSSHLYLLDNAFSTAPDPDDGASVEYDGLHRGACFNAKQLLNLKGVASTIDLTQYPEPCLFYGKNLRGVITGIRV